MPLGILWFGVPLGIGITGVISLGCLWVTGKGLQRMGTAQEKAGIRERRKPVLEPVGGALVSLPVDWIEERQRQDAKWGGPEHDDAHQINDFIAYITKHAGRCVDAKSHDTRHHMIRVAALAVAVVEKIDRSYKEAAPDKETRRRPEVLYEGERWFYGGPDNDATTHHRLYKDDGTEKYVGSDEFAPL